MKEIIIIAGQNSLYVDQLRACVRNEGCNSIICETAKKLVEELEIMLLCSVPVALVIIEPVILKNVSDYLICRLSECALHVPFTLLAGVDLTADVAGKFEQICARRGQFNLESNKLTNMLKEAGVEVTCG